MIGQTVGKYRVEERIGRGGMGTVYRAVDETLRREVAIKVLNSELNDPEVAKRFRAEAITVARLNHAGIATVYELFEHDGQWLMVMEFVRGETLERLIERAGPLSAERAADLCMQALSALAHAHGLGVVHRDLKPANLMLTEAGLVKIMDFGIARVSGSEHLTSAGFMMGTPAYMAPEQVLGHEVDARTDIYALGVVLYRLTTAKLPFKGETPFALAQSQVNDPPTPVRTAREGLPPWLEQVVARALAKAPVERYQTALEFREVLQRCLSGLPFESHFDDTAPTGMLQTPVGLPSGAFGMTTPARSVAIPAPGTGGMAAGQTNAGALAPQPTQVYQPSGQIPASSSTAQTMMAVSSTGSAPMDAGPTGMLPAGTGAIPAGTGATAVAAGPVGTAKPSKKAGNSNAMLIGVAAAVVVLVLASVFMFRRSPAPPSAPAGSPAVPAATAPDAQAGGSQPAGADTGTASSTSPPAGQSAAGGQAGGAAAAGAPASAAPTPAGAAGTGTNAANNAPARGASTPPKTPAAGTPAVTTAAPAGGAASVTPPASGARTVAAPAGTGASGSAPPSSTASASPAAAAATGAGATGPASGRGAADTLILFSDAKLLTFDGRKGHDQDVIINFGGGQISIVPKKGGAPLVTIPYKKVLHATYTHAKDPTWDATLPGLPDNPDIPGFMRGSRQWLMLQWKADYALVYLDDSNVAQVLSTFEARTGLKIDRPADGGR